MKKEPTFYEWALGQFKQTLSESEAVRAARIAQDEVDKAKEAWSSTQVRTRNSLLAGGVAVGAVAQAFLSDHFAYALPVIIVVALVVVGWQVVRARLQDDK